MFLWDIRDIFKFKNKLYNKNSVCKWTNKSMRKILKHQGGQMRLFEIQNQRYNIEKLINYIINVRVKMPV